MDISLVITTNGYKKMVFLVNNGNHLKQNKINQKQILKEKEKNQLKQKKILALKGLIRKQVKNILLVIKKKGNGLFNMIIDM